MGNNKTDYLVINRLYILREDSLDLDEDLANFNSIVEVLAILVIIKAIGTRSDIAIRVFYRYSLTNIIYDPN